MSIADLAEVLIAFIGQSDGDAENGVGGVLIKTGFAVSTEQRQSPASIQRDSDVNTQGK